MTPTVGRVVHYYPRVDDGDGPLAAIITGIRPDVEAGPGHVDLVVFGPGAMLHFEELVSFAENIGAEEVEGIPCWTWPPRVS